MGRRTKRIKKFKGNNFYEAGQTGKKTKAKEIAKKLKKQGYNYRIEKNPYDKNWYHIYCSCKKRR